MIRQRTAAFTLIELLVVIAVMAVIAAILFPVFAQAREKARSVAYLSNLKQIGGAMAMYLQDYDERIPPVCSRGRGWYYKVSLSWPDCRQEGITDATPSDTLLGPEQSPPRFVQEFLHPYVRNAQIWFCPSVNRNQRINISPDGHTYGFNGTTYYWVEAGPAGSLPGTIRRAFF
jgi:prepilin-type N-terminal cleavage/methylation domain-containing protein